MGKQVGIITGIIILLAVAFIGIKAIRHSPQPQGPTLPSIQTKTSSPTEAMSASPSASASSSAQTAGSVKEFTITASNYKFVPSSITVKKGDTVKITFKNSGGFHDFTLDQFNIKTANIPSGGETTVDFVADKTGTFPYYCSVANHRAMGMQGNLTVQ